MSDRCEQIDAAKVAAICNVLKDALPELVTIAFTRFKAELPGLCPGSPMPNGKRWCATKTSDAREQSHDSMADDPSR